jgi:hypothetical protein
MPHHTLVRGRFGERQQSRDDSRPTSTRPCLSSPDLATQDFILLGRLKSVMYDNRPRSVAALSDNIRIACANVTPATLRCVRSSLQRHIHMCEQQDGYQFEHFM